MYKGMEDVFTKKKHDVCFGQSMYLFLAIFLILSYRLFLGSPLYDILLLLGCING